MSDSRPSPQWEVATPDSTAVRRLSGSVSAPEPVLQALVNRGLTTPTAAQRFLAPDLTDLHAPQGLPDIVEAVDVLTQAIQADDRIVVFADRDVDGGCAASILVRLLRDLGTEVDYYVPGKYDGYGLDLETVESIAATDADLLLTVDSGTTAHQAIDRATALGIDVLVTDHHDPDDELPDARACINPRREESSYPNAALSGGGVAFKLGQSLTNALAPDRAERFLDTALPLAAVSTVGDYVRLNRENRAIVRAGQDRLFECGVPGLIETVRHQNVETAGDLRWSLVPLLNAAKESESGDLMLDLLLAEEGADIEAMISRLETLREERRRQRRDQHEHLRECLDGQIEPEDSILLVETEQYVGSGPMNDLSEARGKPVVTYRRKGEAYRGGGRTEPDVNLLELYEHCGDVLEETWGHPGAAGFRLAPENLEDFERALQAAVESRYDPEDLRPTIEIDARLEPARLTTDLVEELGRLGPFGPGNHEPTFLLESIEVGAVERFGDDGQYGRLEPATTDRFTLIDWDGAETLRETTCPVTCDVVGTLGIDDYTDKPRVTVEDYRIHG